jgi:hypothetical protein
MAKKMEEQKPTAYQSAKSKKKAKRDKDQSPKKPESDTKK